MLTQLMFGIGFAAAMAIAGLAVAASLKKGFQFWPPPSANSWQHRWFRILFRIFFVALIITSFNDFDALNNPWRVAIGATLLVIGFGLALWWTGFLGWRNAFGEAKGLKTSGPFAWSRNPIYVVSILGMFGWGLMVGSIYLTLLLCFWTFLYIAAPFFEEPWLEKQYGADFKRYKERVPRFIGLPRRTAKRQ